MPQPKGVIALQREALAENLLRDLAGEMRTASVYLGVEVLSRALTAAAREATGGTSRQIIALAEVFRRGIDPEPRREMFDFIGSQAQDSVLKSYRRHRHGPKGYRQKANDPKNVRFSGGKLEQALKSKDFYRAAPNGLLFINVSELDRTAKQWGRLAFGAAPAGKGTHETFPVRWGNLVVASMGLDEEPREAFGIPRGYWWNGGESVPPGAPGTSEFYPFGEGPAARLRAKSGGTRTTPRGGKHPTRGITAQGFFDAGYATIARLLPSEYERLIKKLIQRGSLQRVEHVTGPVTARPLRPR